MHVPSAIHAPVANDSSHPRPCHPHLVPSRFLLIVSSRRPSRHFILVFVTTDCSSSESSPSEGGGIVRSIAGSIPVWGSDLTSAAPYPFSKQTSLVALNLRPPCNPVRPASSRPSSCSSQPLFPGPASIPFSPVRIPHR